MTLTEAEILYGEVRCKRRLFFHVLQDYIPGENPADQAAVALNNMRQCGEIKIFEFNPQRRARVLLVSAVEREGLSRAPQRNIMGNKPVLAEEQVIVGRNVPWNIVKHEFPPRRIETCIHPVRY